MNSNTETQKDGNKLNTKMQEGFEALIWAQALIKHPNPLLRDIARFIKEVNNFDDSLVPDNTPLLRLQDVPQDAIQEASLWIQFFNEHSSGLLVEAGRQLHEWLN